jgi:Fur family ferric uptake transcriptional regulator
MSTPSDLKNAGLKATVPRLKIINLFEASKVRHLTAEDVYRRLLGEGLDIGLATVYRVLTQFSRRDSSSAPSNRKAVFRQTDQHQSPYLRHYGRVEEFYDPDRKAPGEGRAERRFKS